MTRDEFHKFLDYVYNEHLRDRIHCIRRYWDDKSTCPPCGYELRDLKRALHLIEYIRTHCDNENDIYTTFQTDALRRAVQNIKEGIRWNNKLAEDIGLLDALDIYFTELVLGLDIKDFPEEEYRMLKDFGFHNPKTDVEGLICLMKIRYSQKTSWKNEKFSVSHELEMAEKILSLALEKEFKWPTSDEAPKHGVQERTRRWFKGVGKIGQGAAMSILDICMGADLLSFPVSSETKTWGTLVSATAGIGMVLNGIGELRNE